MHAIGRTNGSGKARRVVVVALLFAACATREPRPPPPIAATLDVVDPETGAHLFAGPAAYTWRKEERVAKLEGFGEIILGDAGGRDACRLVDAGDGIAPIAVYERVPCGVVVGRHGRICLGGEFLRADGARRRVEGCVDEADLVWHKVDTDEGATIAPTSFHRACAPLPHTKKCPVAYLRLDALTVETNPDPMTGAQLSFDDGAWSICWLEAHRGRAVVGYTVKTTCDDEERHETLEVTGDEPR